jgi:hypothetical protein
MHPIFIHVFISTPKKAEQTLDIEMLIVESFHFAKVGFES